MKKNFKTHIGIIVLLSVMGFFFAACGELEKEKTVSGKVTADEDGKISFMYSRNNKNYPDNCKFTTDLPAPNDQFILTIVSGEQTEKKEISGLTAGQKVEWTAKVEGKPLNHGSGNFVHIIND